MHTIISNNLSKCDNVDTLHVQYAVIPQLVKPHTGYFPQMSKILYQTHHLTDFP